MKSLLFLHIFILLIGFSLESQPLYFPPLEGDEWETADPESLGWCTDEIDTLLSFLEEKDTKAFIILKDGKIAIEHYFGTFTQDSSWYWASAGKSLTAFLVGLAQEQGHLSIENKTSDYLGAGWTSCPPNKEDLILVRHQLSMTTGLDDQVPDLDCTNDTCLQYLADAGTRWSYHNAPYTLLGSVIETATGNNLNVYLINELQEHTGITGLYLPLGYNRVYFSNARSMARYGLLILNNGIWDQDTIMTDQEYFEEMVNTSQNMNLSYGYLWWLNGKGSHMLPYSQIVFPGEMVPSAPPDMFSAQGKNDQKIYVSPSQNLVVVRMGNDSGMPPLAGSSFNTALWELLMNVLCTATSTEEQVTGKTPSVYPNPAGNSLTIDISHGKDPGWIIVFDLYGRKVKEMPYSRKISVRDLNYGIYIIAVIDVNDKIILKEKFVR